mgnify:CR=1 FL=1
MTAPSDRGRRPRLPEGPAGHGAAGVGLDLVHVPGLVEQVTRPGTVFAERVFTARERREARRRSEDTGSTEAEHLAARWAAKEAFVKAWSMAVNAVTGRTFPPILTLEKVDWRDIEVVTDRWGRPSVRLGGTIAEAVEASLGEGARSTGLWPVSLTHDGDWAAAIVLALAR